MAQSPRSCKAQKVVEARIVTLRDTRYLRSHQEHLNEALIVDHG